MHMYPYRRGVTILKQLKSRCLSVVQIHMEIETHVAFFELQIDIDPCFCHSAYNTSCSSRDHTYYTLERHHCRRKPESRAQSGLVQSWHSDKLQNLQGHRTNNAYFDHRFHQPNISSEVFFLSRRIFWNQYT